MALEYKLLDDRKEWGLKQQAKIEEQTKLNMRLEPYKKSVDAFAVPDFQYPHLSLKLDPTGKDTKAIPRHDKMPCVWVDTEKALADMAAEILRSHRAIGVDTEYHDLEKVVAGLDVVE